MDWAWAAYLVLASTLSRSRSRCQGRRVSSREKHPTPKLAKKHQVCTHRQRGLPLCLVLCVLKQQAEIGARAAQATTRVQSVNTIMYCTVTAHDGQY
ncbi:hypothetical protein V8C26DRAFT_259608 [Trichoderma gracile]